MVSILRTTSISARKIAKVRFLLELGVLVLVGGILSFFLAWQPTAFLNPPVLQNPSQPANAAQEVRSWALNYQQNLTQASTRHKAFWELTAILQADEGAVQAVEKIVLSRQQNDSLELLAVAVGALSSQGTPEAQQSLCNLLQAFSNSDDKAMVVMPQIMLIEQPQSFLFNEVQAFIRNSQNDLLRENAELILAGLSQTASKTNENLAQQITFWLEQKKANVSEDSSSLTHFLDLLGNTADETFLDDILLALTHENAEVRERAVFALRLFRHERAVSALKHQILIEQNSQVKHKAVDALNYIHGI